MDNATTYWNQLNETKNWLKNLGIQPQCGVVLGTGMHALLDRVEIIQSISYNEIPNFQLSTVESHKGNLVYAKLGEKFLLIMQGRFHFYEGYSMQQIVFPVRVMKLLGIRHLLLTNAAGGMNLDYKKGDLVLIDDHLNMQSTNPLTGANINELGARFPDMSQPYSTDINSIFLQKAKELNIPLRKGIYVSVNGPNLETRAEYRWLRNTGADMVGMSTVPEVIAANHMGLPCAAISVITDECDPENLKPVNIQEIIEAAGKADQKLAELLKVAIQAL
ncbi:MAG: purine-nucleoside phosphorylase [Flavisolibacter sp.]